MLERRRNSKFRNKSTPLFFGLKSASQHPGTTEFLHHIAYGNLPSVEEILETNPRLLIHRGDVVTPSGVQMKNIAPLELALSGGHPHIADLLASGFDKIDGSDDQKQYYQHVREEQCTLYRPHIKTMLNQQPYQHFAELFAAVRNSNPKEITKALEHTLSPNTTLYQELERFREYVKANGNTTKTQGMQFNYNDVLEFFKHYNTYECSDAPAPSVGKYAKRKFGKYSERNLNNRHHHENRNTGSKDFELTTNQHIVVSRLVYGLLMRNFPAYERQIAAAGVCRIIEHKQQIPWSFKLKGSNSDKEYYPVTADDNSKQGLGYDYFICFDGSKKWQVLIREDIIKGSSASFLSLHKSFKATQKSLLNITKPPQNSFLTRLMK